MSTYPLKQIDRACVAAGRVNALLSGLESILGEDRIGSYDFDSAIRNLIDLAREEAVNLRMVLMGGDDQ